MAPAAKKVKTDHCQSQPLINDGLDTTDMISFQVAHCLVKDGKPEAEGEFFKEMFNGVIQHMFKNTQLEERVKSFSDNLDFSEPTITRRTGSIAENLQSQLLEDLSRCDFFSIQLEELTDTTANYSQVLVFFRLVFPDLSVREEIFSIFSLEEQATATEIFDSFKSVLSSAKIPLEKVAAITTNGSAVMCGTDGLIAKCKEDPDFPKFNSFHCASHQLALCCKKIAFDDVLNTVEQIVHSIISKPVKDQLYTLFKQDNEWKARGLLYDSEVRWLSKGNMLSRFFENLENIREFLETHGQAYPELNDYEWLQKLAYMIDLTEHMNYVNKNMQGNLKSVKHIAENIMSVKSLLQTAKEALEDNSVPCGFIKLQKMVEVTDKEKFNCQYFADVTGKILERMKESFIEINEAYNILQFLRDPIDNYDQHGIMRSIIESYPVVRIEFVWEIHRFENDRIIRTMLAAGEDCWPKIARENSYPNLLIVYKQICSFFTNTYLCKSGFSHMNDIKSSEPSTDKKLLESMLISLSNYKPDLEALAASAHQSK